MVLTPNNTEKQGADAEFHVSWGKDEDNDDKSHAEKHNSVMFATLPIEVTDDWEADADPDKQVPVVNALRCAPKPRCLTDLKSVI